MKYNKINITALFFIILLTICNVTSAQQDDRLDFIEKRLNALGQTDVPGLKERVDISVSGVPIQEFIRGLANANELNISVDPNLNTVVYNSFSNETVANILLFLARQYSLDMQFFGSIISISEYIPPKPQPKPRPPKPLNIQYNNGNNLLTLDLQDDTLSNVVKKITELSGKNVILAPGTGKEIVTVYIREMPFDNAVEKMAYAAGLTINKTEDNFLIIEKDLPAAKRPRAATQATPGDQKEWSAPEGLRIDTFRNPEGILLISADAYAIPLGDLIQAVSTIVGKDFYLYSEINGSTTLNIRSMEYESFLDYVFRTTPYTYRLRDDIYFIGDRTLEGLRATRIAQLQYRSAAKIIEFIPAQLKQDVELRAFPELNSLIMSGSQPQMDEIALFLQEVDQVVPLILIEVLIVDLSRNFTLSTGISAGVTDDDIKTGGTILPGVDYTMGSGAINRAIDVLNGTGLFNIGKVDEKFFLSLSALEEGGYVKINSTPKLSTLNGHSANMSIGQTTYYTERTTNVVGSLSPQTVEGVRYIPLTANTSLTIDPIVSGDEHVTLDINVEISEFGDRASADAPPNINTSQFQSLIRVRNEEMVVLGGLERKVRSESGSGLPFLSRIPIIKWFFGKNERKSDKRRFNVFIKPTIIY